jgi:hypothetical protein
LSSYSSPSNITASCLSFVFAIDISFSIDVQK